MLCCGARAKSGINTINRRFLRRNYPYFAQLPHLVLHFSSKSSFLMKMKSFLWRRSIERLSNSQKFLKNFFDSLKFLGYSSSLIFGPLEKYKKTE